MNITFGMLQKTLKFQTTDYIICRRESAELRSENDDFVCGIHEAIEDVVALAKAYKGNFMAELEVLIERYEARARQNEIPWLIGRFLAVQKIHGILTNESLNTTEVKSAIAGVGKLGLHKVGELVAEFKTKEGVAS